MPTTMKTITVYVLGYPTPLTVQVPAATAAQFMGSLAAAWPAPGSGADINFGPNIQINWAMVTAVTCS